MSSDCIAALEALGRSQRSRRRAAAAPVLILALLLGTPQVAFTQSDFVDDFNRPDGPVANGWSNTSGNVGGDLTIRSGTLSSPTAPGGEAGIFRPVDLSGPLTVSLTTTYGSGFGGIPFRYGPTFRIGNDGSLGSGYGIAFARGDVNYPSYVLLILNGVVLDQRVSSFQYQAAIDLVVTFNRDGSVTGSVSGDGNTFVFAFGPRVVSLPGSNFAMALPIPDSRTAPITYPTLDHFRLVSGAGPPSQDAAAFVSRTVPDDSTLIPGQSYTKTWTLRNTGSTMWNTGFSLQYASGNAGCSRAPVAVTGTVAPNATYTFSLSCTAPAPRGTYREDWRLVAPGGGTINIGRSPTIWTQIRVVNGVLLSFGPIASPRTVNVPFTVTLRAVDAQGAVVTSFSGDVGLSSSVGAVTSTKVTLTSGLGTAPVTMTQPAQSAELIATRPGAVAARSASFSVVGTTSLISVRVRVLDWRFEPVSGAEVRAAGLSMVTDSEGYVTGVVQCGQDVVFEARSGPQTATKARFAACGAPLALFIVLPGSACNPSGLTPVILLPGMLGSTTPDFNDYTHPTLPKDGAPGPDYTDWGGLRPLRSRYGLFGYGHVGWKATIETLEDTFGYELGCTLFPAPYDWRKAVDAIAIDYLSKVIAKAKSQSGAAKVDIIAHSMGGLVARAYIQDSHRFAADTNVDVNKLAMVGTPNLGSLKAYYLWQGGDVEKADDGDSVRLYRNTVEYLWKQDTPSLTVRSCRKIT